MVPGDAFFKAAISSIKDVPEIIGLYKVVYNLVVIDEFFRGGAQENINRRFHECLYQ